MTVSSIPTAALVAVLFSWSSAFAEPFVGPDVLVTAGSAVPECANPLRLAQPGVWSDCQRLNSHIRWLEERLKVVCADAGERIIRTVADVEGVYVKPPSRDPNQSFVRFHEEDKVKHAWMLPYGGRLYSLWEMDSFRAPGKIDHYRQEFLPQGNRRPKVKEHYQQLDQPSVKYGVSWRTVGDKVDLARGLYGDETFVFEVATGDVLAVRRAYYYELSPYAVDETGRTLVSPHWRSGFRQVAKACENYRPREDLARRDRQSRESYEFVSRVLKPKPIADDVAIGIFDLAHGSGKKEGGCMVASFGPRIGPEELLLERINKYGLKVTLKSTGDSVYCPEFYSPSSHANSARYRFYDGRLWGLSDINKAVGLNAPTSQDSAP